MAKAGEPKSKTERAEELIRWHFKTNKELKRVYRFVLPENEERDDEPIKLLEVDDFAFDGGDIMPFYFRGTESFPHPVVIATITPSTLEKATIDPSLLPLGWDWNQTRPYEKAKT